MEFARLERGMRPSIGTTALLALISAFAPMAAPGSAAAEETVIAQSGAAYSFDIPAQDLAGALQALASQSGHQISARGDLVEGHQSPAISGSMSVEEALRQLLAGTDLDYRLNGTTVAVIAAEQRSNAAELKPLVVYGEKVQRSYQETYSSVGVATGADIETYKLDELSDVFNTMANVRYFSSNGGNNAMQIRGVNADGITAPENSAPQITVVIDGVVQSSEALRRGSRGTWDLKQVEVLRGPQSTLQGRNAMAGAIVVESNDPTFDYEGSARGTLGNQERRDGAFMLSGPIMEDQVAFRLAGEFRQEEKDIDFVNSADEDLNDDKYRNVRGKLLIVPKAVDGLSIKLTANDVFDQPASNTVTGPDYFDRRFDSSASGYSTAELRKNEVNNYGVDVTYEFDGGLSLRSITALHDADLTIGTAPGNPVYSRTGGRENDDFTQDLRLELDGGGDLTGTVGLFYGKFDYETDSRFFLDSSILFGAGDHTIDSRTQNETESAAVYTDLRYRLTENFSLLGALRFQRDEVRNFIVTDVTGFLENSIADILYDKSMDATQEYDVLLPKAGIAYDLTPDRTVALTVARGYRQGFSQVADSTIDQVAEVDPEFVWTTELAYRDQSIEGLTLGGNIFYNSYKDQQITIRDVGLDGAVLTDNAGSSESYGAEVEGRYSFGNGWQAFGALGVLKTEIKDLTSILCSNTNNICDGNKFPEAPEVTASIGASYRHESGFFAAADASYTSDFYSNSAIDNDDARLVDEYYLANARIGYALGHFSASLYVDNIFDEEYLTGISSNTIEASVGDGRTFGVQVFARF
ncbi:TonB-dependent receptor [Nisaea acidiphila]|uniref:TonB-dependent receptor n=1 Tax=Nisaea acidiphila TaxID=1862145 RepID=A0A9J7B034_9PROT|nr:TonB-dependent receptor [Nisaea acidiphila]UUX51053.1 TonB-dependent receptor [Nisaea acidiphila]